MEHLIANSGIHFISREIEFNPSEPLILSNGRALKYSFCETTDFLGIHKIFDLLCYNSQEQKYIPISEIIESPDALLRKSNGREEIDEAGLIMMDPECSTALYTTYDEAATEIYHINSLYSFRVKDPSDNFNMVNAFELLLNKWLPMPMFRREVDGVSSNVPLGWCRMRITRIGEATKKGIERFRLDWAFDTELAEDQLSMLRPYIAEWDTDHCAEYSMCNKADLLLGFMSSEEDFHAFSDYIASLLGIDLAKEESRKYKAFYIYLLNFIRLSGGAPEVTLHDKPQGDIPVDLVLDIGNSRTCGILFEEGQFTKGKMLELRNLTTPHITYENKTFDMRVVFRMADFGLDIVLDEEMFKWRSFVRIGDEARKLVYKSLEEEGLSEKTTNHSSPKRYLWDTKRYAGQWENLATADDSHNIKHSKDISIPRLSKLFKEDGTYSPESNDGAIFSMDLSKSEHHYSRASLMTFAYIEMFQQAIAQINSVKYREMWGNIDCRRYLRNIIITAPTAMPLQEQVFLRKSAADAFDAIRHCTPSLHPVNIIPDAESLKITDDYADIARRTWSYDEASCCQLVYLFAEVAQRYSGEIHKFFELKGHLRAEHAEQGSTNKSLTIGTIDIGAGTTDIIVCSYEYEGEAHCKITPTPLFWDSFYLAGDDILRNLVQNVVIEGKDYNHPNLGNICSALTARITAMSNEQLAAMPCYKNIVYRNKINDIASTHNEEERREKLVVFASNLIHDFFGTDSSMMSYRDRRCRNDFNTQISVPIAQRMMELLRTHRPSRLYTFDELFAELKPADYLLDFFEEHFGFRFEELNWRYDPKEVSEIVKSTMEPLMKQLALVLYTQHCDIIVLAGRPTSLDPITELFIKYMPTTPDRLIRLNDYRVGHWFPTADGQGYFYDQKAIVAVGGMVGYAASTTGLKGLVLDFSKMIKKMKSTANYLGEYNTQRQQVTQSILTPTNSSATITSSVFPTFIGCRQFDSSIYQARPLYAIYNHGNANTLQIRLSRSFNENKEQLIIEEATDNEYRNRKNDLELVLQSIVDDGKHWLDKGEFELTIK
ncbi:MAG: virulence factor SrfB [Alistipes sp.]|nr:virulence factor SrfB [Alistipes sp.]